MVMLHALASLWVMVGWGLTMNNFFVCTGMIGEKSGGGGGGGGG
jgi:hypothetical protein